MLGTAAGQNFIRTSKVRPEDLPQVIIKKLPAIRDATRNPIKTAGRLELLVRLGLLVVRVEYIFCEVVVAPSVLGCAYCPRFIAETRRREREMELEDGSTVPTVRTPSLLNSLSLPLALVQEPNHSSGRASHNIRVAAAVPPSLQS